MTEVRAFEPTEPWPQPKSYRYVTISQIEKLPDIGFLRDYEQVFDCERATIIRWIKKHGLPVQRLRVDGKPTYQILKTDFVNWCWIHDKIREG